jgi:hypothetical protein
MTCVADYKLHLFPDDIEEANLWLRNSNSSLRVRLDVDSLGSAVSVELDRPDAREASRGLLESILEIVKPHGLFINGFLNPPSGSGMVTLLAAWLATAIIIALFVGWVTKDSQIALVSFMPASIILSAFYFIASKLRPYTVFDTRLNQRRRRTWNFLMLTVIVGLIIGIVSSLVAAYLNKKLF